MNILKKYIKQGVIITGSDNVELDTPTFEIINISIDTVNQVLHVEILHEVQQGSLTRKHIRTFEIPWGGLPSGVKVTGKSFLDSIEAEILKLPQYQDAQEQ